MVEHLVFFKFGREVSAAQRDAMYTALCALKDKVPGILALSAGPTFTMRGKGFEAGLRVQLVDRAALDVYLNHPLHQKVLQERVRPIVEDVIAIDYEAMG